MTTIVWDGTTLATDSLISVNGSTYNHAQKLFRLDNGEWVAFAGEQQEWWEVLEWLNAGAPRNDKPHVSRVEMIIAGPDGVFEMFNKLVRIPVKGPWPTAPAGSGRWPPSTTAGAPSRRSNTPPPATTIPVGRCSRWCPWFSRRPCRSRPCCVR